MRYHVVPEVVVREATSRECLEVATRGAGPVIVRLKGGPPAWLMPSEPDPGCTSLLPRAQLVSR
jgi:hypothetical protein